MRLVIPIEPVPKGRARCSCRKIGKGPNAPVRPSLYTPAETREYEATIARYVAQGMIERFGRIFRFNGPLRLTGTFVKSRPVSMPQPPKEARDVGHFYVDPVAWKAGHRLYCPTKPDADNYLKAIADSLDAVVWNDAQIVSKHGEKFYAAVGEPPSVRIDIEPI